MQESRLLAEGNILIQKGENPSLLVIALNSDLRAYVKDQPRDFEFSHITAELGCSRIHCRDPRFLFYHAGFDRDHPNIPSSVQLLRELIADLAPEFVITTGVSAGGYAALLLGHLLSADYVHALDPLVTMHPSHIWPHRSQVPRSLLMRFMRLWSHTSASADLFDIAECLADHNGRTQYFVHYCAGSELDRRHAEHIRDLPGFTFFAHACERHEVATHLVKHRAIVPLLRPEVQPRLSELLSSSLIEMNSEGPPPSVSE